MTDDWAEVLAERAATLAPTPDGGPLEATVTCRTSRAAGAPSARHRVGIDASWAVATPHDLASERLAVALGGYLSCLDLVDTAVPALRAWLLLEARLQVPHVAVGSTPGCWVAASAQSCCPRAGFRSVAEVARHLREPVHVARAHGADARQLRTLAEACRRAHASGAVVPLDRDDVIAAAPACVGGRRAVVGLWDAGIHPRVVAAIAARIDAGGRLPGGFFVGVVTRRPDLRWVSETLAASGHAAASAPPAPAAGDAAVGSPDPSLASWLAWSQEEWDARDPGARGRWLALGVTRPLIRRLGAAGYDPDEIGALADASRRHPDAAARTVIGWLDAGFSPDPVDLARLARAGVPARTVPAAAAVRRLRAEGAAWVGERSDTDLALVLAAAGSVPAAVTALRDQVFSW